MTDCAAFRDLLSDELDGRISPADASRLAEHVKSCAACADEKRGLASLRATFRAMPRVAAPPGFRDSVVSSLPRGRLLHFPRALGWIAAVAAVAVVAVTLMPVTEPAAERTVADARVPMRGERRLAVEERASPPPAVTSPPRPATPAAEPDEFGRRKGPGTKRDDVARESAPAEDQTKERDEESAKAEVKSEAPPPDPAKPGLGEVLLLDTETKLASNVRYVVFTDAVAAQRFAASLVAAVPAEKKDKAADATGQGLGLVPGAATGGTPMGPVAGSEAAASDDATRSALLLKQAAFTTRRVVARTALAAPVADEALAARVRQAGGELVRKDIEQEFVALLDVAPARAAAPLAEPADPAPDSGGGSGGGGAAPAKDAAKERAPGAKKSAPLPPPVIVVVVVLEPPAGAKAPAPLPAPSPPPEPPKPERPK